MKRGSLKSEATSTLCTAGSSDHEQDRGDQFLEQSAQAARAGLDFDGEPRNLLNTRRSTLSSTPSLRKISRNWL
jgi:hypothetical protein